MNFASHGGGGAFMAKIIVFVGTAGEGGGWHAPQQASICMRECVRAAYASFVRETIRAVLTLLFVLITV